MDKIYGDILKENKTVYPVWHLDETYIKVKEEWRYLYRIIDGDRHTLAIQLRRTRDHQAAYMFMKRLVKAVGEPSVLTTDKASTLLCAFKKLKKWFLCAYECTVKYLSNLIEQDHRHIKRRFVLNPQDLKVCGMLLLL